MTRVRHLPRWLTFAGIVVVLVVAALGTASVGAVRRPFPQQEGEVDLAGIRGSVEVLRGEYGVPRIYADTVDDLFEAQGYVNAQDRFYEMDVRRHIAAGRLSELFGASQVETDTYIRTLGWYRVAQQELKLLSPAARRALDAYAAGVNAYLREHRGGDLSLEYGLLAAQGVRGAPEPWTPADSLAWLKVMAWDLAADLDDEVDRSLVTAAVGQARTDDLYPAYPLPGYDPIVKRGAIVGGTFMPTAERGSRKPFDGRRAPVEQAAGALRRAQTLLRGLPVPIGSTADAAIGSNSWVVRGSHTASGDALLSNDTHLRVSMPSVFTQVGLHCRAVGSGCPLDVAGFSLAGVPGVVVGKNAAIAWGLTTSYVDAQDLYLEDVRGDTVRVGDRYLPLAVTTEQIAVRGEKDPRTVRVRSSRHGPLLSDASQELRDVASAPSKSSGRSYAVALSWVGTAPGRTLDALLGLNGAQDFAQFRAAAALLGAPSQNLVYADRAGNIGYQLAGAVPERGKGDGIHPSPGWDPAFDWQGVVPFAELPYVRNPPSGVIVAANQPVIGTQYRHRIGSSYSYGWRSQQVLERLAESKKLDVSTAETLFYDDTIRFANEIVPTLLRIKVSDPWVREGQSTLVGWDYRAPADSAPAAYFNVVVHNILKLTFRDQLPESLWPAGGDRWYAAISRLMAEPTNPWWDDITTTDRVETRDDILLAALTSARREITSLMARDTDGWQWGRLHTVTLRNQTLGRSGIAPVEALFNRGAYPVPGGPTVVNAMSYDDREGYAVTTGPAMRMLVDLGAPDQSRWVNQTGSSGHAYHRNYDDQVALWTGNRTWPFVSSAELVREESTHRLVLRPAG